MGLRARVRVGVGVGLGLGVGVGVGLGLRVSDHYLLTYLLTPTCLLAYYPICRPRRPGSTVLTYFLLVLVEYLLTSYSYLLTYYLYWTRRPGSAALTYLRVESLRTSHSYSLSYLTFLLPYIYIQDAPPWVCSGGQHATPRRVGKE